MMKLDKIVKGIFRTGIIMTVFMLLIAGITSPANAEDLPDCKNIKAGSERCVCEHNYVRRDLICNVGYACVFSATAAPGSPAGSVSSYSCTPLDKTENSGSISNYVQVSSTDSYKFTPCRESCLPSCYYEELETCSFCSIFKTFYNTASKTAQHSIVTFSGSIKKVVILGFGIWIALQILAFVSTPEVRDLKDLASSLITQSFVVMVVVIILENGAMGFFNYALTPVYTTGQNIAQAIIQPESVYNKDTNVEALDKLKGKNIDACKGLTGIEDPKNGRGALPKAMGDSIICTMTLIQNRVAQVKALGNASICKAWEEKFFIIPHLNYLLIGIGLWVGAMVMLIAVPFMMVDAVFELSIAAALLPFGIGAYAFKLTRGYTKKIWETFLNSMFKFVFISLVSLMLVSAYQSIISGSLNNVQELFGDNASASSWTLVIKNLPWFSTDFLKLVFVMILSWAVLNSALEFAGEFAGSISNTSIGSSIGTMAGSFTKSAATKILEPTADAAATKIGQGVKTAVVAPVHFARRAIINAKANRIERQGRYDAASGEYVLTKQKGNTTETQTVVTNPDGSKTLNTIKVKQTKNGSVTTTKVKNGLISISTTTQTDKDGNVVASKERIKHNSSESAKLFNREGALQQDLGGMMLTKGSANADKINIALAKAALKQRMPNTKVDFENHKYVSQEAIYDNNGKFIGYIETYQDGSKSTVKLALGEADATGCRRLMTHFTNVDAKGRGTTLASDGIINQKSVFKTVDGTVNGKIKDSSVKTHYTLGARFDYLNEHGAANKVDRMMDNSMFSSEEIIAAKRDIRINDASTKADIYEFARNYE